VSPKRAQPGQPELCALCLDRIDKDGDPSVRLLARLEGSFKWEARTLYITAVGVLAWQISATAGLVFSTVGCILVIVMDTTFSAMITTAFLLPILEVLGEGKAAARHSAGYKKMQQTKWMTMFGATLSVLSSTLLYVNFMLWLFTQGQYNRSPWLNPWVFGLNMDSICNDVGMIFACGVLKGKSFSISVSVTVAVVPEPGFVPNSQASSVYGPEEL
jgi:hypothetical protein